jgi:hypothetical protein
MLRTIAALVIGMLAGAEAQRCSPNNQDNRPNGLREPLRIIRRTVHQLKKSRAYRTAQLSVALFFTFEAVRNLPVTASGRHVGKVTKIVGWMIRNRTTPLEWVSVNGAQTDEDGKSGDPSRHPLAMLASGGRTFWFGNEAGYESEMYFVLEVTNGISKMIIASYAGSC